MRTHAHDSRAFSKDNRYPNNPGTAWTVRRVRLCAWAGKRLCGKIGSGSCSCRKSRRYQGRVGTTFARKVERRSIPMGISIAVMFRARANCTAACRGGRAEDSQPSRCSERLQGYIPPFEKVAQIGCNVAECRTLANTGELDQLFGASVCGPRDTLHPKSNRAAFPRQKLHLCQITDRFPLLPRLKSRPQTTN